MKYNKAQQYDNYIIKINNVIPLKIKEEDKNYQRKKHAKNEGCKLIHIYKYIVHIHQKHINTLK